jgi:hypothetical protein
VVGLRFGGLDTFRPRAARNHIDGMSHVTEREAKVPPSMVKVATLATLGVLVFGAVVGGGIYWSLHRFGSKSTCPAARPESPQLVALQGPELKGNGWMIVGDASILKQEAAGSAYYLTMGGRCEYWLVVRNKVLVAYKARLPGSTCAIIWNQPRHSFICNATKAIVPLSQLPRWPAREITSGPNKGNYEINFT